ncbi:Protein CBG27892 [Caenorhabditis briggsae]|uniref:Protein CBG27892 n=1 Tax=Caenorhabditis briggsae TaxID=6238 RepID=B6IEI7_CAEBR|nr:Protein CBG27892 [Caenorhabditis briggsae]CAR98317.1 Protein CBG27892 [Caenorhabditis briggsae]
MHLMRVLASKKMDHKKQRQRLSIINVWRDPTAVLQIWIKITVEKKHKESDQLNESNETSSSGNVALKVFFSQGIVCRSHEAYSVFGLRFRSVTIRIPRHHTPDIFFREDRKCIFLEEKNSMCTRTRSFTYSNSLSHLDPDT